MGIVSKRYAAATALAVVLLLASATYGKSRAAADPDRSRLERHLAGLPVGDTIPGPIAKMVAVTIPQQVLGHLRFGGGIDSDGMIGFLFGAARSPYTSDTTREVWAVYAGDGEWGYLGVFSQRGDHARRLAGRAWTMRKADSLVRVAPPQIRFHRADSMGLAGFIIRIDGLLDVAGNQSEEVLRWNNVRIDRFTETFSGRARREGGLTQTRLEFKDVDGDGVGEFVVYSAPSLRGETDRSRQTPLRVFKYDPEKNRFTETDLPPGQPVD